MPALSDPRVIRFDDFEFDRHTLELRQRGAVVKLQQQPARVLSELLARGGDLVERDELRRTVWGDDTYVDFDRGLNYCIKHIRAALGDTIEAPRYLETLRGRGYRFIGRIEEQPQQARPSVLSRVSLAAAAALLCVLAVWGVARRNAAPAIGVAALSASPAERHWADAMHAQLVSRLSSASRVPVIDLAQSDASTRWRVEGRVDRSPAQYRVTMLLRDTRDGSVRWSDVFAGSPGDWVDAQSEMAQRMTEVIRYRVEGPSAGPAKRRQKLPSTPMSQR